jgi:RNA polymerase sigma factor (sigma-70 family)
VTQRQKNPPPDSLEPPTRSPGRDPGDIEQLYREHNAALLRFVTAKLGSQQEAREVAQEAYVRLLRLDRAGAVSYLEALLFKTAANLALDRIRARARRPPADDIEKYQGIAFESSPDRSLEAHQAVEVVRKALAELPEKCRRALLLNRVHGLNQAEIGARLGLQERMVRTHLTRALEHLKLRLDQAEGRAARSLKRSLR